MEHVKVNNLEEFVILANSLMAINSFDNTWSLDTWKKNLSESATNSSQRFPCIICGIEFSNNHPANLLFYHPIDRYAPIHISLLQALIEIKQIIDRKRIKELASYINTQAGQE